MKLVQKDLHFAWKTIGLFLFVMVLWVCVLFLTEQIGFANSLIVYTVLGYIAFTSSVSCKYKNYI